MSANRRLVHTERVPIRWGDMDAVGHVNNTVYFRYMEQARVSWIDRLGVRGCIPGQGPALVSASCAFLKPLVYPGDVEIRVYVGGAGRSSIKTWLEMRPSYDPEVIYAQGTAKLVWIDYGKRKSAPLPQRLRSAVEGEQRRSKANRYGASDE